MTHIYQWAENLLKKMIPEFSNIMVKIQIARKPLGGQQQPNVYDSYESPALISASTKLLDERFRQADKMQISLPVTENEAPSPGDLLTLPDGKTYKIEMVEYKQPAGRDIGYKVQLSDG